MAFKLACDSRTYDKSAQCVTATRLLILVQVLQPSSLEPGSALSSDAPPYPSPANRETLESSRRVGCSMRVADQARWNAAVCAGTTVVRRGLQWFSRTSSVAPHGLGQHAATAPRSKRMGIIDHYARAQGFRNDNDGQFSHKDGGWIARTNRARFP